MESSHSFPAYYTVLCARAADAIDAIDQQRYQEARALLIAGMQDSIPRGIKTQGRDGGPAPAASCGVIRAYRAFSRPVASLNSQIS